jgi:hypothetical protein
MRIAPVRHCLGHLPQIEQPDGFARLPREHLGGLS